jgi:hypothetical protein
LFCAFITLFTRCGFVDLRPVSVSTYPDGAETVLPDAASPVSVSFDTEMQRIEVERIFCVESYYGKTEGDFRWEGNRLYFSPAAGWIPGTRYMLSLNGTAYSKDGRDAEFSIFVPFYAVNREAVPYLKYFYPEDGASTGVMPDDGGKIKLVFSESMNGRSVEDAFSIDGVSKKIFAWNDTGTEVEITSDDKLNAWSVYRWTLGIKAASAAGVPLPKSYSAQFTTNKDAVLPFVKYVSPVLRAEGGNGAYDGGYWWQETGGEIENRLGYGQGIAVVFNKAMDKNSVVSGLRFAPSITGIVEQYSADSFVFLPARDPEIGVTYRLTVSADTKDVYGLKLASDYTVDFIADIKNLEIISIKPKSAATNLTNIKKENFISFKISKASKECRLDFHFSPAIDDIKSRENIARSIRLDAFFPGTLASPVLRWAHWTGPGNDTLELEWADVTPGTEEEPYYYKLTIPGGVSGIANGSGSFMKDTVTVYFEITEMKEANE